MQRIAVNESEQPTSADEEFVVSTILKNMQA
jgi:hypothetical protein